MTTRCLADPRRRPCLMGLFVVVLALAGVPCRGAESTTLSFADHLFEQEDYYRAITEYQRALYFSAAEDQELRSYATAQIGEALFRGREYYRAAAWLEPRLTDVRAEPHRTAARRLLCRSLFAARDAESLREIAGRLGEPEASLYTALALGVASRWDAAAQVLSEIPDTHPRYEAAQYDLLVARSAEAESWKSPTKAGVLSVMPGLGYLYAGHPKSALTSFLVNAGFALATVRAFDSGQPAFGSVLALFSVSWYRGNIVGSMAAARRSNAVQNEALLDQLRD